MITFFISLYQSIYLKKKKIKELDILSTSGFGRFSGPQSENERKMNKYPDLARGLKKTVTITIVVGARVTVPEKTGGTGDEMKNRDTEKILGDLWRLAATLTESENQPNWR